MVRSKHRLGLAQRSQEMQTGLPLRDAERRFLDYHRAKQHAQKTIEHYEQTFTDLDRFIKATNRPRIVGVLTTSNLDAFSHWLAETPLRQPWRGSTKRRITGIHGRMKDLRTFVRWCIEEDLLPASTKVTMPKLPEQTFTILTDEQLVAIFSCKYLTAPGAQGIRNRALLGVLLDTGVRLSEVANIRLKDVFIEDRLMIVRGKGSKTRHVPFGLGTQEYLEEWLEIRPSDMETIFGLTHHGVKMFLYRVKRVTGIHLHAHLLRHQAATMMVKRKIDLHSLRRILGHAQLSTVEIYLTLSNEDLRDKHNDVSPMETIRGMLPGQQTKKRRRRLQLH